MVDTDTFLTVLYVMADAFCKCQSRPEGTPGLRASLTGSEVVTLVIFSQWGRFRSERDFYTLCRQPTSVSFPDAPPPEPVQPADPAPLRNPGGLLPSPRIQYGAGSGGLAARTALPLEVLDSSGVPTRSAKRRGAGWLAGKADIGWSNRLGWYESFHLLLAFGQSRGRHHRLQLCPSQRQRPDLGRRLLRLPAYSPSQAAHFGGASPGLVCSGQRLFGPAVARLLWSLGNLSAQTQQQESPAQRIAPMAGWDAPDGGDRLRQAPPCLQAGLGAPAPTGGLSNQGGGQGRLAQFLYLVEPATGPPIVGFCRLACLVTSPISHQALQCQSEGNGEGS